MPNRGTVTVQEAAEYLERSSEAVRRAIRSGRLPAARIGRRWRIRRTDLDAMFEAVVDPELAAEAQRRLGAGGQRVPLAEMKARLGL